MPNLFKRVISSLVLIPLVLFIIIKGGIAFFICALILYLILLYEWVSITSKANFWTKILWWMFGFFYISTAMFTLILLERYRDNAGDSPPWVLLMVIFIAWASDIFAYFFGKTIGGRKIAPKISPNKTWAGFYGGIVGTCILFLGFYLFSPRVEKIWYWLLPIFMVFSVISVIGDFFESWVKRKCSVKDSGSIIPGHGGFLDRMDGLILMLNVIGIFGFVVYISEMGLNF